jgi:beta-galactosidase
MPPRLHTLEIAIWSVALALLVGAPGGLYSRGKHRDRHLGLRQIELVEHGPFKLNGNRVLLQETHRHADQAGAAVAMSDDQVREEMHLIRDMGANFIRLAHYQQDRLVLDLCDELGLMVWEEVTLGRAGWATHPFSKMQRTCCRT